MYRYWIVASVLLTGCGNSTGSDGDPETQEVIQLPQIVEVTTVSATETWYDILEFEPNGDTLFIAGTILVDGVPTESARTYDVCEIDALVILPTYLDPMLLDCALRGPPLAYEPE